MPKLFYQPEGYWFGDCMPYFHDGKFYLFHQRDNRNPGPFGEPFGWDLSVTRDFVTYEDMGTAIPRGGDDEQDRFIFAGCVYEAGGSFHAIYTGFNDGYAAKGKPAQVMMTAESPDLISWTKTNETVVVPQPGYDPDEWRDPFVFWNDETGEYNMLLGARRLEKKLLKTGRTVLFTSKDAKTWDFKGDFWAPDLYSIHEMPDLFRVGDWWYLVVSENSDKSRTIYRRSKSRNGPWTAPVDFAFDGRAYYAARTASDGDKRYLFGWVPTKQGENDLADWDWGGALVVHQVYQRSDGSLGVRMPETMENVFADTRLLVERMELSRPDGAVRADVCADAGDVFMLDAKVRFMPGTRRFDVCIFENGDTGDGYQYQLDLTENRLQFDKTPHPLFFQYMNKGLERPFFPQWDREYDLKLVVDGDICVLYIDGTALSARMYDKRGKGISFGVTDGGAVISEVKLSKFKQI